MQPAMALLTFLASTYIGDGAESISEVGTHIRHYPVRQDMMKMMASRK
jgi:hypothetical protein